MDGVRVPVRVWFSERRKRLLGRMYNYVPVIRNVDWANGATGRISDSSSSLDR